MVAGRGTPVDYVGGNGNAAGRWYRPPMQTNPIANPLPVGILLREWRQRRRLTQMDLALDAEVSPRHLSFVETGRAQPSREMLLHLSELHPKGVAPRIENLPEWRAHLLARLRAQVAASGDAGLRALHEELSALPPMPGEVRDPPSTPFPDVVVRLEMDSPLGRLALFSTITVFGTPVDVTLSELALEAFYPADEQTGALLRAMAAADA